MFYFNVYCDFGIKKTSGINQTLIGPLINVYLNSGIKNRIFPEGIFQEKAFNIILAMKK